MSRSHAKLPSKAVFEAYLSIVHRIWLNIGSVIDAPLCNLSNIALSQDDRTGVYGYTISFLIFTWGKASIGTSQGRSSDGLKCTLPAFIISNANYLIDPGNEDLSISDLPCSRSGDDRANHTFS